MPSKKRKYEARFPPARIKKIMQTDEEIGKVAAAVPIIISRSLEIFLQSLVETTAKYTSGRKAKTMTTVHLKHNIENEKKFDFLRDLVANIADVSTQDEEDATGDGQEKPKKIRKPRSKSTTGERKKKRKASSSDGEDSDGTDGEEKNVNKKVKTSEDIRPPPIPTPPLAHSIDSIIGCSSSSSSSSSSASLPSGSSSNLFGQNDTTAPSFPPIPSAQPAAPIFDATKPPLPSTSVTPVIPTGFSIGTSATNDEDDDYDA